MTLPSSGSISAQQIDKTLFRISGNTFSLNDSDGRALSGNVSGPISYSSFYGLTNAQTSTFSTPGSFTYTVPNQVTNLTMIYPTPYGNTSIPINWVTPGQIISGVIGSVGTVSSFGNLNTPIIDTQVFYINALVNSSDEYMFTVVANTAINYFGSNTPSNLTSSVESIGMDFFASQTNFGIQKTNIKMTPVSSAVANVTTSSTMEVYVSAWSSNSSGAYYTFVTSPASYPLGGVGEVKHGYQQSVNSLSVAPYPPPSVMENGYETSSTGLFGYGGSISTSSPYVITLSLYNTAVTGNVTTQTQNHYANGNVYTTNTVTWYPNAYSFSANINVRNIVPITIIASA
jgi:hypothetical protein